MTIHDPNAPGQQREVTKLHQDDFFGEVALMEKGFRTATVVAETDVSTLSLTRRYFRFLVRCPSWSRGNIVLRRCTVDASLPTADIVVFVGLVGLVCDGVSFRQ